MIKETIYLGTNTCYLIQIPPELEIKVRSQNVQANGDHAYRPGTCVHLKFPPESLRVVNTGV